MFGIGSTELLVILVVALIVLGPKSLAGISRSLGKAMGEFRRVSTDFQRTLNAEVEQEEQEKRRKEAAEAAAKQGVAVKSDAEVAAASLLDAEAHIMQGEIVHNYTPQNDLSEGRPAAETAASEATLEAPDQKTVQEPLRPASLTGPAVPPADSPLAKALADAAAEARAAAASTAPLSVDRADNDNGGKA